MKNKFDKFRKSWSRYFKSGTGSIAPLFAITLPIVVGAVGMAIDIAQAYLVRERLSHALDAAALAAAAATSDDANLQEKVEDFFYSNYPPEKIGITYDLIVEVNGDDIDVSASADYYTTFLRVLGIQEIPVDAFTSVRREVKGLEVVMVLDYTGSMGSYYSGKRNIERLQEAATLFINTIFERASNPDLVKIAIVPYSTSVNVGPYGLGEYPDGSYYDDPFVNNPLDLEYEVSNYYGDNRSYEWGGCVLTDGYDDDVSDHDGPWDMYRWCRNDADYPVCDYYYRYYQRHPRRRPNYICPTVPLVPLTNNQEQLLDTIDAMDYPKGHTLGNYGMVWGWRVISPDYPFTEGVEYDDIRWRKAVLMMTDGNNTMHYTYSAYGDTDDHSVGVGDLNERFEETCTNMKDEDILIYTVTFTSSISDNTKGYYRRCASQESQYFDSPDPDDLVDIFGRIGRELSNLHIRR